MRFRRRISTFAGLTAFCLSALPAAPARADEAGSGGENINGATANPERFLYQSGVCRTCAATDVTNNPRAQNLNPEGINYADCEGNLRMDFSLALTGFTAGDDAQVQVWAGTVDCSQQANRVLNGGALHPCWQVANPLGPLVASAKTVGVSVYARDVLRYEQPPADPTSLQAYDPTYNYSAAGEQACHVQPTDAAVPLSIFFVAVDSTGATLGVAYEYSLTADLVAPPPPTVPTPGIGDTLLTVDWTSPGDDPDIVGFAIYSDPPSGIASSSGCSCGPAPGSSYAEDAETTQSGDGGVVRVCTDAGVDAAPSCHNESGGTTPSAPVCASTNLSGHSTVEGSGTADSGTPATTDSGGATGADGGDDGGDGEAGTGVTLTGGGNSDVSSKYLSGEVDSNTATSAQLVGLTNGILYKVAVASLDGSGNVGPLSPIVCATAGAVNDFWQTYKDDGGSSSCALERAGANVRAGSLFGLGLFGAAAALWRRRRRAP
jgi:hypothetical protein